MNACTPAHRDGGRARPRCPRRHFGWVFLAAGALACPGGPAGAAQGCAGEQGLPGVEIEYRLYIEAVAKMAGRGRGGGVQGPERARLLLADGYEKEVEYGRSWTVSEPWAEAHQERLRARRAECDSLVDAGALPAAMACLQQAQGILKETPEYVLEETRKVRVKAPGWHYHYVERSRQGETETEGWVRYERPEAGLFMSRHRARTVGRDRDEGTMGKLIGRVLGGGATLRALGRRQIAGASCELHEFEFPGGERGRICTRHERAGHGERDYVLLFEMDDSPLLLGGRAEKVATAVRRDACIDPGEFDVPPDAGLVVRD